MANVTPPGIGVSDTGDSMSPPTSLYLDVVTDPGVAPGAGLLKLIAVEGGTGKATLRAYAGTSTTPVDIVIDVGSGV